MTTIISPNTLSAPKTRIGLQVTIGDFFMIGRIALVGCKC